MALAWGCGDDAAGPDADASHEAFDEAGGEEATFADVGADEAGAADDGATDDGLADDGAADAVEPDPSCTTNGCLREATLLGRYSKAVIEAWLAPGVTIDNGYAVWSFRFWTDGAECLGTATIPWGVDAPAGGWHVVSNEHGTSGVADACAVTDTVAGAGLAGLFGARGMFGIAPDYPGLGTAGTHPYLVARSEGRSALDALRAADRLAAHVGVPVSGRHALVGLSQGGHAVLSAAAEHAAYAPELDIRGFAASGPASVWEEQWRTGAALDGPHLVFHALLAWAWAAHYGGSGPTPWADGLADGVDEVMESLCLVSTTGGETLFDALGESRAAIFAPAFLAEYATGAWDAYAAYHDWFGRNRVGPYEQTAPLRIYQGDADDTVLEPHTRAMVEALRAGGVEVEYEVVAGGGHTDVAFGFVAYPELRTEESIAWVRERLAAP
ncbi:MAG: hypothetical protein JXB32_24980 [Deltaproteobacteria bacterium]|nr:hypothetical protein [Deltaproteobacteria bacterium]